MKLLIRSLILILILLGIHFLIQTNDTSVNFLNNFKASIDNFQDNEEDSDQKIKLNIELVDWIGKKTNQLKSEFGEPISINKSLYDYDWYIYKNDTGQYLQFGIKNDLIVTVFALGIELEDKKLHFGMTNEQLRRNFEVKNTIEFSNGQSIYKFLLKDEDLNIKPLIKLSNDLFLQLYFDTFRDELVAIRLLDRHTLLAKRPYELHYHGDLEKDSFLTKGKQREIEKDTEKQIFHLTNRFREQQQLPKLNWDENVAKVAYRHSKDMKENAYFSHDSLDGRQLKDRLLEGEITFTEAGENIAAEYVDAADVVIGWLNSKGHREAMFHEGFTNLGVGVHKKHYTQNFISKSFH